MFEVAAIDRDRIDFSDRSYGSGRRAPGRRAAEARAQPNRTTVSPLATRPTCIETRTRRSSDSRAPGRSAHARSADAKTSSPDLAASAAIANSARVALVVRVHARSRTHRRKTACLVVRRQRLATAYAARCSPGSSSTSRIRLSSAVRRTLKSSGERSSSSRSRSTGSSRLHREGRAALGEALDRDLGGAELADRVLEADQLREVAERADLDLDRALEELLRLDLARRPLALGARRGLGSPASASASVSSCTRRLTSTASRSAFIRIRVAWPRACAWISSSRAETASSEAMLRSWRSFGLAQLLVEAADLALALDHHPRERGQLGLELGASRPRPLELGGLALELRDLRVPCRDRRVHFGAAVAEEGPLEATHARHRRGALGRRTLARAPRSASRSSSSRGASRQRSSSW